MKRLAIPFVLAVATRIASAADCPPTAVVEGDGALVDSVSSALSRRGIAMTSTPNCPVTNARLEKRSAGVAVIVVDPSGRRSERMLADTDAAAALIESWARQDMTAAALLGWTEPPPVVVAPVERVDAGPVAPAVTELPRDPFSILAAGETSVGFDGSTWLGGRAGACLRIGPVCAGAAGRVLSGEPGLSYEVLAVVDVPYAITPRIVASVGAGAGVGWFASEFTDGEATMSVTHQGVRLDGHAALSVTITRMVALHAGIALGASPQAPFMIDPTRDSPLTNGEPSGFFRGDVGLRLGVP